MNLRGGLTDRPEPNGTGSETALSFPENAQSAARRTHPAFLFRETRGRTDYQFLTSVSETAVP